MKRKKKKTTILYFHHSYYKYKDIFLEKLREIPFVKCRAYLKIYKTKPKKEFQLHIKLDRRYYTKAILLLRLCIRGMRLKEKIKTNTESSLMMSKIISDFIGKDEKILMFRKVKNKLYLFVVKSKAMGRIPLNQKPKAYPISQDENLWALISKLIKEEKKK